MHVLLTDRQGRRIFAHLDTNCEDCVKKCEVASEITTTCGRPGKRRRGRVENEFGTAYFCSDSPDLLKSGNAFRRQTLPYVAMLGVVADAKAQLYEDARKETKRLLHNLTSLNAKVLQELYLLVPQEELATDGRQQIKTISTVRAVVSHCIDPR